MTTVYPLGILVPGDPDWAEARRERIGGSEVAAALGLSPWCSPFTLWHRKRGSVGPAHESDSMRWGKLLEPVIRDEYQRRHPEHDVTHGQSYGDEWRIAAPDAEVHDTALDVDMLWEGKTADSHDAHEWGPDGSDYPAAIPPYYRVQCLWYMDVLGVGHMSLSVLIGGNDYREYDVPWDQGEADDIRERVARFHRTVIDGIRPSLDDSTSTYDTVRELHPDIDPVDKEVPPAIGNGYLYSDRELKAAKRAAQQAKTALLDHMGTARIATVGGIAVARRQPGRGGAVSLYPLHPEEES